jgi:hypothetical protein
MKSQNGKNGDPSQAIDILAISYLGIHAQTVPENGPICRTTCVALYVWETGTMVLALVFRVTGAGWYVV